MSNASTAATQVLGVVREYGAQRRFGRRTDRYRGVRRASRVSIFSIFSGMRLIAGVLIIMLVSGLLLLGSAWYAVYGHVDEIRASQNTLEDVWDQTPVDTQHPFEVFAASAAAALLAAVGGMPEPIPPLPGGIVTRLWAPTIGEHWIVVEGVDESDIASAPGHYPKSALPGQRGNFAVAGHRGIGLFRDINLLNPGDQLVAETRLATGRIVYFIYVVTGSSVVTPSHTEVVSATPPGWTSGSTLLTLTTCDPWWDRTHRLIVHARYDKMVTSWQPPS